MRNRLKRVGQVAYLGILAGVFSFGAVNAVEVRRGQCEYDPPTMLGECFSQLSCQRNCEFHGGWLGECEVDGCCYCAI